MNSTIIQGLTVSITGLLVTFVSLGVFIFIMIGLQKLFPPKPAVEEVGDETDELETAEITVSVESDEEAVAAAIAYALNYFQSTGRGTLGADLEDGRGVWWVTRQMSARPRVGQKR